jgi:MFS family permease
MPSSHDKSAGAPATEAVVLVAVLALSYVMSQLLRNSVSVIAPNLVAELAIPATVLGLLTSAFFFSFAAMQLPLGVAMDRFGPKICMVVCAVVMTAGTAMFALAATSFGLIVARTLMGIGTSCYLMAPLALYARRFPPERFAMLAGVHMGVGGIGTLLGTAPLAYGAATIGWRASFVVIAVATAVVGIVIVAIVREARTPAAAHHESWRESVAGIREAARIPSVRRLFLMHMATHSSFMLMVGLWGGPYLSHIYGYDLTQRGLLLLVPGLAQMIGLFAFGFTDRMFGAYKPGVLLGATTTLTCYGVVAWFGELPRPALVIWLFVLGFGNAYIPALVAHGKSLFPIRLVGRGMTLLNMWTMGGVFVVQFASGLVVDLFAGSPDAYPLAAYRTVFGLQALFVLLAIAVYLPARDPLKGR